jgi:hypothetical protein
MATESRPTCDFQVPNCRQLLAAAAWLLLAIGSCTSDVAREIQRKYRLHPNDPGSASPRDAADANETRANAKAVIAEAAPTRFDAPQLTPMEQEREKRRQELMNESTLSYGGPTPGGDFGALIWLVPCWLLFGVSAVLMLMTEVQWIVGCAIGGWTLWAWACQVAIWDMPRWT